MQSAPPYTPVSELKDLPESEHYVILEFDSIHHEADERSRTNPGHGYGGYSEAVVRYRAYINRPAWEQEIEKRSVANAGYYGSYSQNKWVALVVKRAKITTQTIVTIAD